MNTIHLKPTELLAIEVPEDTYYYEYNARTKHKGAEVIYDTENNKGQHNRNYYSIPTWDNFEILGIVTKDVISFDVDPYVESKTFDDSLPLNLIYKRMNGGWTAFKEDAFHSLLFANDIFVKNPYGEKYPTFAMLSLEPEYIERCNETCRKWQQAEDNLVKKLLILKTI